MTKKNLHKLIAQGENEKLEFKSSFNTEVVETLTAFANTKGGKVLIGINDAGKAISSFSFNKETIPGWVNEIKTKTSPSIIPEVEIIEIQNKKIVIFSMQEYPIKPISVRGKYFKRVANSNHLLSTSEVVNMHLQSFNTSWDYHTNNQFVIDDISFDKVQLVIDRMNQSGIRITEDPLTFLIKNDLIRDELLTNAGFLLFTKNDTVLTTIELGRFQTDIIIKDTARTKTDILTQIYQVLEFVQKHINKEVIITGKAQNTQKWQYPLEAIREIVMNMIVHRDYRSSSDSIVKVFNNKIEFYNPGRLPENITVDDLLSNNYISTPRNKLIADFCKNLGLIEKYGSGIRRIVDYFLAENLPVPEFRNLSDGFMVTVFSEKPEDDTDHDTDHDTDKRLQNIISAIKRDNRITVIKLAKINRVSKSTILRDLVKLKESGILERVGSEKSGYWKINTPARP